MGANLLRDLGFSLDDRIEHARRMGWMCDRVVEVGAPRSRISFARRRRPAQGERAVERQRPSFDPQKPTALFVGRSYVLSVDSVGK
jgi:hypothetical protein